MSISISTAWAPSAFALSSELMTNSPMPGFTIALKSTMTIGPESASAAPSGSAFLSGAAYVLPAYSSSFSGFSAAGLGLVGLS